MARVVTKNVGPHNPKALKAAAGGLFSTLSRARTVNVARERLLNRVINRLLDVPEIATVEGREVRVRDCGRVLQGMLLHRSEELSGFSVLQALFDIAHKKERPDLEEGFYAEMIHLLLGVRGEAQELAPGDYFISGELSDREAAVARSKELDSLWQRVETRLGHYPHGLMDDVIEERAENRRRIADRLGATEAEWFDWRWQLDHVVKEPELISRLVSLRDHEAEPLRRAKEARLPFGVTPYYLSLMDDGASDRDRAIRAQVFPSRSYVDQMLEGRGDRKCSFDFMLERDTSPTDLVTRRYPGIVILKPYNACPQVCVYCQRNWEIDDVLADGALAPREQIQGAIDWIRAHPAIMEVLITGGDPFAMSDDDLRWVLDQVASIPSVQRIRIGTRTLVTMPMRITDDLVAYLESLRVPLKREISVVTHVQHPYEITPEMHQAVERLRGARIPVYNQTVFTFFVSRRFEASCLRILLKRVGIDPYYTFNTKGKDETVDYRVPIARLLQEQKEEARLLPGMMRTDETVYNVPGFGKNYLRALQHRDLLSILPDGSRVYEFHPWEKNIVGQETYVGADVPILDYMKGLEEIGETVSDYETIWYYY